MAQQKRDVSLEDKLKRLDEIARMLDAGDRPLDEQLKAFEEGMALAEACRKELEAAELRVLHLSQAHQADPST